MVRTVKSFKSLKFFDEDNYVPHEWQNDAKEVLQKCKQMSM